MANAVKALLLVLLLLASPSLAAPFAVADHGGIKVMLTDEPCKLPAVTNLPRRATWTEGSITHEGCWAAMQGVIVGYFADKTVVIMPREAFVKAEGT